jgi:hypothetical protein
MSAVSAAAFAIALSLLALASSTRTAEGADGRRDFAALWDEARRWAGETHTVPHECVFIFRFEPGTRRLREGHAATCEEPYRSPFFPWPEPSRPAVRFTVDDVERHGREIGMASRGTAAAATPLESCDLVVGFTSDGQGAEAIECYQPHGNVPGQRANTQFVVLASSGRRLVSGLYERIAHLGDRAVRQMFEHRPGGGAGAAVRIEGTVVGRTPHRLLVRGRALPSPGVSGAAPGVLTSDATIAVAYPSDSALRPGYYLGGQHCFEEQREVVSASGRRTVQWRYGPCPLGPDRYWIFEHHPMGQRTVWYGPYLEYGACDAERRQRRSSQLGVAGHCVARSRAALRMRQDGSLVVPGDAPPFR